MGDICDPEPLLFERPSGASLSGERQDSQAGRARAPAAYYSPGGGGDLASFQLLCQVDGELAVARWAPDRFVCDPHLFDTATVLVAMGEVVGQPDGGPDVQARMAPDDPLRMLLTLIRAADRVLGCQVTFACVPAPRSHG